METETNKVLTVRSPVAEVEAELTRRRILLQPAVGGSSYAVDDHFSKYAYDEIESAADALRLCDELDEECGGYCVKACQIRSWLAEPSFWTESAERVRVAVAANRRVCCARHETGSMAIRR